MSDEFPQYAPRPRPAQLHPQYEPPRPPGRIRSNAHLVVAGGIALMIGAIVVGVCYQEATATRAADATAVAQPTATPGPPVPQPVEMSPPIADTVPGDGSWVIGREIKRGTYRTAGRVGCYWQRLQAHPSGKWLIVDSAQRDIAQTVALDPADVAFASQGCEPWVMVR